MGIPNLKPLFEDDDFITMVHILNGQFIIHSVNKNEMTIDRLKKAAAYSDLIDDKFKSLGVKQLHTWAEEPEQDRYNKFLGYTPTGEVVGKLSEGGPLPDDYPNEVRVYVKDLI